MVFSCAIIEVENSFFFVVLHEQCMPHKDARFISGVECEVVSWWFLDSVRVWKKKGFGCIIQTNLYTTHRTTGKSFLLFFGASNNAEESISRQSAVIYCSGVGRFAYCSRQQSITRQFINTWNFVVFVLTTGGYFDEMMMKRNKTVYNGRGCF